MVLELTLPQQKQSTTKTQKGREEEESNKGGRKGEPVAETQGKCVCVCVCVQCTRVVAVELWASDSSQHPREPARIILVV